jgi:hypothetical protein
MQSIINPAYGLNIGMVIDGYLDESPFDQNDFIASTGGLTRTAANMGCIHCADASQLFSMEYGMVTVVLNLPQTIVNGIYAPLIGKSNSANPDMVIFAVNPGEHYVSPPCIYAALTPVGIEFTIWSTGTKVTLVDTQTNVSAGTDVAFSFAWDYSRRILWNGHGQSMVFLVNGIVTKYSNSDILPDSLSNLFQFSSEVAISSSSSDDWQSAPFYIGDLLAKKNGLVEVVIKRIEIYNTPYGLDMGANPNVPVINPVSQARSEIFLNFSVEGARWIGVNIESPDFKPMTIVPVSLLDVSVAPSYSEIGEDLGKVEDNIYPETPNVLPLGISEKI